MLCSRNYNIILNYTIVANSTGYAREVGCGRTVYGLGGHSGSSAHSRRSPTTWEEIERAEAMTNVGIHCQVVEPRNRQMDSHHRLLADPHIHAKNPNYYLKTIQVTGLFGDGYVFFLYTVAFSPPRFFLAGISSSCSPPPVRCAFLCSKLQSLSCPCYDSS